MKKFLFLIMGMLMTLPAVALEFKYTYEGQTLNYRILDEDAKTAEVTLHLYTDITGALVIPAEVTYDSNVYSVTQIGSNAFVNKTELTSVIIPNSVKTIDDFAFAFCTGLTSLTIPNSVTRIGAGAFLNCTGLTSLTIPNSVTTIGDFAFSKCTGLTSVTLPNSVTVIGGEAFSECTALESVFLPKELAEWGDFCFLQCPNITTVYYLADEVKSFYSTTYFDDDVYKNAILYLTEQGLNQRLYRRPWSKFENVQAYDFNESGVDEISVDVKDFGCEYYNINGVRVNDESMTPGIYIKRQGNKSEKILVK